MIKLNHLQEHFDLDVLLEPKKKVYDLVLQVNSSMLNFHKTVKTSKEIENLAEEVFQTKNKIKKIKDNAINPDLIAKKIEKLKPSVSLDIDFI